MFEKEKRETPYRGLSLHDALPISKEAGKRGRKRFLAPLEMTAWGMDIPMTAWGDDPPYRIYLCLFCALFMIGASRK